MKKISSVLGAFKTQIVPDHEHKPFFMFTSFVNHIFYSQIDLSLCGSTCMF
jgi:hypothetical protein